MIIKFKPIPISKVWGGKNLSKMYNIDIDNIGEIIGISAHHAYSNVISNGPFKNLTFNEFFSKHRNLFGNFPNNEFPLLFKVIDAAEDLSIQVHPNDEYAKLNEHSFGKDECWYILDKTHEARIQIGHHAKTLNELIDAINNSSLESLLDYHKINIKDYYYIPSGKVHAICKNTTLLEVSQSSNITYRLFDYNRLDNGKLRELHIKKSLDVITVPDTKIQKVHDKRLFTFDIIETKDEKKIAHLYGDYIFVVDGNGHFNDEPINKNEFIMVTSGFEYNIKGNMELALVHIKDY
jgi:mannose-6-phosphate isomerase